MDARTISRTWDWTRIVAAFGGLLAAGFILGVELQEGPVTHRDLKPANVAPVTSDPPWPDWADEDSIPSGVR